MIDEAESARRVIASLNHNFRTPVAVIDATCRRVERQAARQDAEWMADQFAKVRRASRRVIAMVESTLWLVRIDRGMIALAPAAIPLAGALAEALADIGEEGFTLPAPGTERAYFDAAALSQVLSILGRHARVAAGPAGRVVLAIRAEGARIVLDILIAPGDCGAGLAPLLDLAGPGGGDVALETDRVVLAELLRRGDGRVTLEDGRLSLSLPRAEEDPAG